MNSGYGYGCSWSGFLDYDSAYEKSTVFQTLLGTGLFLGTGLSLVPQLFRVAKGRTSFGLSPIFVAGTSLGQVLIAVNYVCLHTAHFVGIVQVSTKRSLPRMLTFFVPFILWFAYLPVLFQVVQFYDRRRVHDGKPAPNNTFYFFTHWIVMLAVSLIEIMSGVVYLSVGAAIGFFTEKMRHCGVVLGIISGSLTVVQYAPQIWKTYRLKDNGAVSLITLGIQAPGGTANTLFMIFNHDSWSTWLSLGSSAAQQWFLLGLCIYYKIRICVRKRGKLGSADSMSFIDRDVANEKQLLDGFEDNYTNPSST
jgi:uncharacterized protein with PQ loop repeat